MARLPFGFRNLCAIWQLAVGESNHDVRALSHSGTSLDCLALLVPGRPENVINVAIGLVDVDFDALEAMISRRRKAVKKSVFGEQVTNVGGEARHVTRRSSRRRLSTDGRYRHCR